MDKKGEEEKVVLNVGGEKFTTYKSTLLNYPDTLLARMFSTSASMVKKNSDGEYFFDRDPNIFREILAFYRTNRVVLPKGLPLSRLVEELQYFGVDMDEEGFDIVANFLTFNDIIKKIGKKGHKVGGVVAGFKGDEDALGYYDEDDEDSAEKRKTLLSEIMQQQLKNLVGSDDAYINSVPSGTLKEETTIDKHTQSDDEEEKKKKKDDDDDDDGDGDNDDSKEVEADEKTEKIFLDLSNGGWFEFDPNEPIPHLFIKKDFDPSAVEEEKPKKAPEVVWSWAGDSGKKGKQQDKWIEYDKDPNQKIEAAYQAFLSYNNNNNNNNKKSKNKKDGNTFQVDKERYIDFTDMKQKRYDDPVGKQRKIQREEIGSDDEKPVKKAAKKVKAKKGSAKKAKKSTKPNDDCGPLTKIDIPLLESVCNVAPYGDLSKMKTVIDKNVRVALECDTKRFRVNSSLLDIARIDDYVKKFIFNERVEMEPYKINVYGKGGFFKAHVDTPVDPGSMIGTLVLCLPTPHKGGALIVKHGGIEHTYDFSALSETPKLQWAAFFSDCEHEVKEVEEGHRVTITYTIHSMKKKETLVKNDNNNNNNDESEEEEEVDENDVGGSLKYHRFEAGPVGFDTKTSMTLHSAIDCINEVKYKTVGLLLGHKYTITGLTPENLKGKDRTLFEGLSKHFDVELLSIVIRVESTKGPDDGEGDEEDPALTRTVYSFNTEDVNYFRKKGPRPKAKYTGVPFVVASSYGTTLFHYHDGGSTGAAGNYASAEDDSVYMSAAFMVSKKKKK